MIYSLILVAIDSKSDYGWGERKKKIPHSLGIQSKFPVLIGKHDWLGKKKKSYFFKLCSYHSWFGVAIATEGIGKGELSRSHNPES